MFSHFIKWGKSGVAYRLADPINGKPCQRGAEEKHGKRFLMSFAVSPDIFPLHGPGSYHQLF